MRSVLQTVLHLPTFAKEIYLYTGARLTLPNSLSEFIARIFTEAQVPQYPSRSTICSNGYNEGDYL
jgi:hypothetical protein